MTGSIEQNKRSRSVGRDRDPAPWEARILRLVAEQSAIPLDLLAAHLEVETWVAVRLMKEFAGRRWVKLSRFFVGDGLWVSLREPGAERSGTGFDAASPNPAHLPQLRALCQVRFSLEAQYPEGDWTCERALLRQKLEQHHMGEALLRVRNAEAELERWALALLYRKELYRLPTGVFQVRNADGELQRWAIEIEQAPKDPHTYAEIVNHRRAHYHRVLYFCSPSVAQKLKAMAPFRSSQVEVIESLWEADGIENFQWKLSPASKADAELARGEIGPGRTAARKPWEGPLIEPWQVKVLRLIAEQEAIPVDQLARFLDRGMAVAQGIANRLDGAGLVRQGLGPVGEKPWLWVSAVGARLAETGIDYRVPDLLQAQRMRLFNEARLAVQSQDSTGKWLSRAVLRQEKPGASLPAGVMKSTDSSWDYAVEVEPKSRPRSSLIEKYERRYAEHRSQDLRVMVLCSPSNFALLEELREECNWEFLYVRECKAFNPHPDRKPKPPKKKKPGRRKLPQTKKQRREDSTAPLEVVKVEELSPALLHAVRKAEGGPPTVLQAGKRKGYGHPRWRITTEREVWRVSLVAGKWHIRPAGPRERGLVLEPPEPLKAPKRENSSAPLVEIPVEDLTEEALDEIQAREGLDSPPKIIEVGKRTGPGFLRLRITTERNVWRASRTQKGWHVWPSDEEERALKLLPAEPRKPPRPLVRVDTRDLPEGALQAVEEAEASGAHPAVKLVGKAKGRGRLRFRVTTERNVWRVVRNEGEWMARPADEEERAVELLCPPSLNGPNEVGERPRPLVEIALSELPEEILWEIQQAEGAATPPVVTLAARRKGPGVVRWRLTTDRGVWGVMQRPRGGWKLWRADEVEQAEEVMPPEPPKWRKRQGLQPFLEMRVDDLPEEVMQQVRKAEGSHSPVITHVARRKGGGAGRWRVTTEREVWRVLKVRSGWQCRAADEEERAEGVLPPESPGAPKERGKPRPLFQIDVAELPVEIVERIQRAERSDLPPTITLAARRKGLGIARWRVNTERNCWGAMRIPFGWRIWEADQYERAEEVRPPDPKKRPKRNPTPRPLVQIDVAEVPAELLQELQKAEGSSTPPVVTLAARRKGAGVAAWRVTTEGGVWAAIKPWNGWRLWPSDEAEREEGVLPPERKEPRQVRPFVQVDVTELRVEVLAEIQQAEGTDSPPTVTFAAKRKGPGVAEWRVSTDRGVWGVRRIAGGWRLWPSDQTEREEEVLPSPKNSPPVRSGAPRPLVQIDVVDLDPGLLAELQKAEGSMSTPNITLAAKRKGHGVASWRLSTDRNVWGVLRIPGGWRVWPSEGDERAEEVLPPEPPRSRRPRRKRKPRRWPLDPPGVMEDIPASELPLEALIVIQKKAGSDTRPQVRAVSKRRRKGAPRWRVETDMDIWRVTFRPDHGWNATLSE